MGSNPIPPIHVPFGPEDPGMSRESPLCPARPSLSLEFLPNPRKGTVETGPGGCPRILSYDGSGVSSMIERKGLRTAGFSFESADIIHLPTAHLCESE